MLHAQKTFVWVCFRSKNLLKSHEQICGKKYHAQIFPSEDKSIHYKNHEFNFKRIFAGYADFESVLVETNNVSKCPRCDISK